MERDKATNGARQRNNTRKQSAVGLLQNHNLLSQDSQQEDDEAETETLTPLHNDSPNYYKSEVPKLHRKPQTKVILNQPSVLDELDDDFS